MGLALDGEAGKDRVSAFYSSHSVLITGGTGFIGKLALHRLLQARVGSPSQGGPHAGVEGSAEQLHEPLGGSQASGPAAARNGPSIYLLIKPGADGSSPQQRLEKVSCGLKMGMMD